MYKGFDIEKATEIPDLEEEAPQYNNFGGGFNNNYNNRFASTN